MATDSVSHHPGTELAEQDSEDPLGYGSPSTAFYGLVIALISFVLPLIAVVTDAPTSAETGPPEPNATPMSSPRPMTMVATTPHRPQRENVAIHLWGATP